MILGKIKRFLSIKQFNLTLYYNKNPLLEFIHFSSPSLVQISASFIVSLVAALFLFRDILPLFSTHLLGGFSGDAGIYAWLLSQDINLVNWSESNAFYPYGKSIAWSDNYILPRALAKMIMNLGASLPVAWNLIFLLSNVLLGIFTFRLLLGLTGDFYISILFGVVSQSLLPITAHLGHPQLQYFFVFPLFLTLFFLYIKDRSWKSSFAMFALTLLAFFISVYYSFFLILYAFALFFSLYLLKPHFFTKIEVLRLSTSVVIFCFLIFLFALPYVEVREAFGQRKLYESFYFAANPLSYFSATTFSLFYKNLSNLSHSEAHLFGGFSILLLSIVGFYRILHAKEIKHLFLTFLVFLIWGMSFALLHPALPSALALSSIFHWISAILAVVYLINYGKIELKYFGPQLSNRSIVLILYFLAFIFYLMSLGPMGNPEKGALAIAPYTFSYYFFPGIDSLRAVGRFGLIAVYVLSIISALTLWQLYSRRILSRLLVLLIVGLIFLENQTGTIPIEQFPRTPEIISKVPRNSIAISLPMVSALTKNGEVSSWTDYATKNVHYMNWFSKDNIKIINGYSGQKSKLMKELPRELKDFPDKRSVLALKHFAGLEKILFFPKFTSSFNKIDFEAKANITAGLKIDSVDSEGNYLFSFNEDLPTISPFELLVHPKAQSVSIRVKPLNPGKIQVFAKDPGISAPLYSFEIGITSFTYIDIQLPKAENDVRPIRLLVGMEDNKPFLLGKTSVRW